MARRCSCPVFGALSAQTWAPFVHPELFRELQRRHQNGSSRRYLYNTRLVYTDYYLLALSQSQSSTSTCESLVNSHFLEFSEHWLRQCSRTWHADVYMESSPGCERNNVRYFVSLFCTL